MSNVKQMYFWEVPPLLFVMYLQIVKALSLSRHFNFSLAGKFSVFLVFQILFFFVFFYNFSCKIGTETLLRRDTEHC